MQSRFCRILVPERIHGSDTTKIRGRGLPSPLKIYPRMIAKISIGPICDAWTTLGRLARAVVPLSASIIWAARCGRVTLVECAVERIATGIIAAQHRLPTMRGIRDEAIAHEYIVDLLLAGLAGLQSLAGRAVSFPLGRHPGCRTSWQVTSKCTTTATGCWRRKRIGVRLGGFGGVMRGPTGQEAESTTSGHAERSRSPPCSSPTQR